MNQLQATLNHSEDVTSLIMNSALDAIICIDASGNILVWSKQAEKLFGWSEKEVIGKLLADTIIPEQYREMHTRGLARYLKTGEGAVLNKVLEISAINNKGTEFPIELTVVPIKQGDELFFCSFIRDITKRKKAEAELHQSELRYRSLVDQASDAIMITDTKGNFSDVNISLCKLFGYTREELLRSNINELIDPEQLKNDPIRFDLLMAGKAMLRERRMMRKDGTIVEVEANVKMLPDGRVLVIAREITDRKKAEAEIEASEKKLRQVLSSTPDNFYVIDRQYNVILINETAEKNLENAWKKEVKVGTNLLEVLPETGEPIRESFEKVFRGENVEYELRLSGDDLPSWVLVSYMPVHDESGMITGAYVIAKDISLRKKAEELVKLNEQQLKLIYNTTTDIIFLLSVENGRYKFKSINKTYLATTGLTEEQVVGKYVEEVIPPSSQPLVFAKYQQAITERKTIQWEGESDYPAGRKIGIVSITPVFAENGDCDLLLGTVHDITDVVKARQQIEKERDLSDSIINSLPGIFYLRDLATGHCLRWNKNFETVTGKSPQEITTSLLYDCIGDEYKDLAVDAVRTAVSSNEGMAIEADLVTKSGNVPYYITGLPINYEERACLMGTGTDISARKKAEEELRESEQKYKLLFESNPMPMFMFSRDDFKILDVNESAIRHYGYSKKEFLEMKVTDLRPTEDLSEFLEKITAIVETPSNLGIWKHRKKNGAIISVEIIGYDITYQNKQARLTLANDVTEKLAAEEKLKQSYNEVRRLTNHLQNIREEERTHIAREIHDELGQQLTVLKMDVSWLNKKISSDDLAIKEKLKGLIEVLDGTVKTVRRISSELRPSLLDDLGLTAAIEWHLKEFEKRSGTKTNFNTDNPELSLPDEMKTGLFRILQESLTNVARHANAKNVSVSLNRSNSELILKIEDDGRGFDKLEIAGKKTLGVLGMEERTRMMGGNYQIMSNPGKGTLVTVSVPVKLATDI